MTVVGAKFGGRVSAPALLANALAESEQFELVVIATVDKEGNVGIGWTSGSMLRTIGLTHQALNYISNEMEKSP